MKIRDLLRIIGIPVIVSSLCCLSPVILVILGLSTASFAGSLADTLYGDYKWIFRGMGFLTLILSLILYVQQKGICTLKHAQRRRNEIVNILLISIISAIGGYFFFLYIVVEYLGIWLQIWK